MQFVHFFIDVDECGFVNDCKPNSRCLNVHGGYNCDCKDGYTGDGKSNCTGNMPYHDNYIFCQNDENFINVVVQI